MIYVNNLACDGCGECFGVCPTGALIYQNHRAFIDQEHCLDCSVCLDACSKGAILSGERQSATPEIIRIAEVPKQVEPGEKSSLHDIVLPAIGSLLLWTGRELAPRLADVALGYLDQRIQRSRTAPPQQPDMQGVDWSSRIAGQYIRKRRRQRHRRNNRYIAY